MSTESKKINGKTYEEWIKGETSLKKVSLWGQPTEFTPEICSTIDGDGLQLIYIGSINQRPYYWLLMIDSKTKITEDDFEYDDLISTVEEDFGRHPGFIIDSEEFDKLKLEADGKLEDYESFEEYESDCDYPHMWWGMGGHWGLVVNFGTGEVGE